MVSPQVTAGNDINNVAVTDVSSESHYRKETTSGVFGGGDAVIPVRQDLIEHLTAAKVSGRQISGGHNESNFMTTLDDAKGTVVSKTEIAPGIYEVKYQLPKGIDKPPETKTVYDPKIYSDAKMADMAQEAAARGIQKYMQGGYQPGELIDVNISGVNFKVAVKNTTGSQTSANNPANLTVPTVFPGKKEH